MKVQKFKVHILIRCYDLLLFDIIILALIQFNGHE